MDLWYNANMTKTLESAVAAIKTLPESRQEEVGEWLRDFVAQEHSKARLTPGQNAEVYRRMHEQPEQPVSEAQAASFFKKFA